MERFAKTVNGFQPFNIFTKRSILYDDRVLNTSLSFITEAATWVKKVFLKISPSQEDTWIGVSYE